MRGARRTLRRSPQEVTATRAASGSECGLDGWPTRAATRAATSSARPVPAAGCVLDPVLAASRRDLLVSKGGSRLLFSYCSSGSSCDGSTLSGTQLGINPTTDANGNLGTQAPVQLDVMCWPTRLLERRYQRRGGRRHYYGQRPCLRAVLLQVRPVLLLKRGPLTSIIRRGKPKAGPAARWQDVYTERIIGRFGRQFGEQGAAPCCLHTLWDR